MEDVFKRCSCSRGSPFWRLCDHLKGAVAGQDPNDLAWNIDCVGNRLHEPQCTCADRRCTRSFTPERRASENQPPIPRGRGLPSSAHRHCGESPTSAPSGPMGCQAVHQRLSGHSMKALATHLPSSGPRPRKRNAPSIAMHSTPSIDAIAASIRDRARAVLPARGRRENRSTEEADNRNTAGAGRPLTKAASTCEKRLKPRRASSAGYRAGSRGPADPWNLIPPDRLTRGWPEVLHLLHEPCRRQH
jgi:hypothetical protein